jgi:hypothetical protein
VKVLFAIALMTVALCSAAAAQQTELEDCVGPGADFCFDSTGVFVDEGCGVTFYRYRGTIAWPAILNVGPVTISVLTRDLRFGYTDIPLYVEVRGRANPGDDTDCRTHFSGQLVLVAQGGMQCGGTWESIGPLDLRPHGVPLGAYYNLQLVFFEAVPGQIPDATSHSIGFACIRVTSHPSGVEALSWGNVKRLYKW